MIDLGSFIAIYSCISHGFPAIIDVFLIICLALLDADVGLGSILV